MQHRARRNITLCKTLYSNQAVRPYRLMKLSTSLSRLPTIWLVGCFGFNDPLRQYFSLYRVVSQREGERGERIVRPLPYYHPNCRTPRHWKFTQDHRTTRPPPTPHDLTDEGDSDHPVQSESALFVHSV